jgi:hypothetical protein
MRKLKIIEHISLDGVIQVSGDDGDFPHGDWTAPYRTPAGRDEIIAAHGGRFDLLLGRRTYDAWSGFWPKAPSSPMADGLNAATKYIATHRPQSLEWGPFEGRLSGPVGHGEALLRRGNPATLIRARQHESNAVRRHPQSLQGRRAFEDRIVSATPNISVAPDSTHPCHLAAASSQIISGSRTMSISEYFQRSSE